MFAFFTWLYVLFAPIALTISCFIVYTQFPLLFRMEGRVMEKGDQGMFSSNSKAIISFNVVIL